MKKKVTLSIIVGVLTLTMVACQFSGLIPSTTTTTISTPTTSAPLPNVQSGSLSAQQSQFEALYQAVIPGIVTVQTTSGLGTGFVYSTDGYVVTNSHVVGSEKKVEVDFNDGNKVYGNVVGTDDNTDLAVIKVSVSADQLHPLSLGDSNQLKVGEIVAAIGDPEVLIGSMTTGIISAVGRGGESINTVNGQSSNNQSTTNQYYAAGDIIQTDALVNHGNSGGPLLNLNGQVVGVIWEMQPDTETGYPTGIGYAISVNTVKRIIPELIKTGKYAFPYMGMVGFSGPMPLDLINTLGLKSTTGAYVLQVVQGGPADKAGLKAGTVATSYQNVNSGGDLVIAADGHPIQQYEDLVRYLLLYKSPGDKLVLTVLRGSQKLDITLTLGTRPS